MATQLSTKDKIKDTIVVFASGVAIFFGGLSLVMISSYLRQLTLVSDAIKTTPGLAETYREPLIAFWSCLIICGLFVILGAVNIAYVIRYLRNSNPKNVLGFVATFGALAMTVTLMVGYVVTHFNSGVSYVPVFIETSALSGTAIFVYYVVLFVVALAAQIANIIVMFIWEDPSADKFVDITQTTPGAIMLDKESLKHEKKTPPMLNADPNAPVRMGGGHSSVKPGEKD